ncbi:MAG: CHAP domain-containing protein [Deltaproteobacteria bacterium]|nr:CHAP domain-containing protein [Deltaproteobacteria bacterium]
MRGAVVVVVAAIVSACAPLGTAQRRDHPLLGREVGEGPSSSSLWRSPISDAVPQDDSEAKEARLRLAAAASSSLGAQPIIVGGVRYRFDCSGVASGIYARAGFPLGSDVDNGGLDVRRLYDLVKATGSLRTSDPLPGDLVFFDDTYDYNGNGQIDDPLSHVGVVERVVDDGTVVFVHRIGQQVVRARLNLARPSVRHDDKRRALNHYLRSASGAWPAKTTGELFVAFGSLPVTAPERLIAAR